MSLAATCWWTLARTVVLCLLAWPVCRVIERSLNHLSPCWRPWLLAGLLAPCCFPELLVGYAFRDLALARPDWAEALCSGLLFVRMIPVGTIALLAAPRSSLDATALYCRQLLGRSRSGSRRQWLELARCYWHGPIVRALPALALMSIVAFQEFELAALLQTMSWTDWFVAAERVGLDRGEMLRQSLLPLLWQTPLLLGVLCWLRADPNRRGDDSSESQDVDDRASRWGVWFGVAGICAFLIVGCLIPLLLIGWRNVIPVGLIQRLSDDATGRSVDGLSLLFRQRHRLLGLALEMSTSGAIAACAGVSAWILSGRLKGLIANALLLGLFGSLLLSLGCVALFQLSWLRPLYDTPIPWVLALVVWLLPRAAILRLWLHALRNNEAIHLAEMLRGARAEGQGQDEKRVPSRSVFRPSSLVPRPSPLLWHLRDQPQFLAMSLLCYWAYCDLPTAYLLAPTGMASGLVRLYNFMHFGRSAALSAEATVFFGVPVVCFLLVLLVNRRFR